jgi:hypothetical protein
MEHYDKTNNNLLYKHYAARNNAFLINKEVLSILESFTTASKGKTKQKLERVDTLVGKELSKEETFEKQKTPIKFKKNERLFEIIETTEAFTFGKKFSSPKKRSSSLWQFNNLVSIFNYLNRKKESKGKLGQKLLMSE